MERCERADGINVSDWDVVGGGGEVVPRLGDWDREFLRGKNPRWISCRFLGSKVIR